MTATVEVASKSAAAAPSTNHDAGCFCTTARQWCSSSSAHNAAVRSGGPKSGVGTVKPNAAIISTAMAARRADDRAAEQEHADIGRGDAELREQIDAEQAARAERGLGEPIGQRRAEIAVQREMTADRQHLWQIPRRRRIKHHRHQHPQRRLGQRREREYQRRTRAQAFDVERDGEHRLQSAIRRRRSRPRRRPPHRGPHRCQERQGRSATGQTSGGDGSSDRAGRARRNVPARCSPLALEAVAGWAAPRQAISRSRVTLATIDAAAIEATMPSPPITASQSQPASMRSRPSTKTRRGLTGSEATARASAHSDARRILSRSIRAGGAIATATWARAQMRSYSTSRRSAVRRLESSSPRGMLSGSRITAAATTGPASGPRPASSQPATGHTPRLSAERSRRKVGRSTSSARGRRGALIPLGLVPLGLMAPT